MTQKTMNPLDRLLCYLEQTQKQDIPRALFVERIVPIFDICAAKLDDIQDAMKQVIATHLCPIPPLTVTLFFPLVSCLDAL